MDITITLTDEQAAGLAHVATKNGAEDAAEYLHVRVGEILDSYVVQAGVDLQALVQETVQNAPVDVRGAAIEALAALKAAPADQQLAALRGLIAALPSEQASG
jgi:hypothetical protein